MATTDPRPYFLPHPAYAEEQPYSHSILVTHVLYRGIQTGALLGGAVAAGRYALQSSSRGALPLQTKFLRASGAWSLWTAGFVGVGLCARMWGCEPIEWQDRAWRLLESRGQRSVDRWSGAGALAGAALGQGASASVAGGRSKALVILGAAGWGSLVGCAASLGWRGARGEM